VFTLNVTCNEIWLPHQRDGGITATELINPLKFVLNYQIDNIFSFLIFDLLLSTSGFTMAGEFFLEDEDPGSSPFGPTFVRRVMIG
jgi:hypothetical protein